MIRIHLVNGEMVDIKDTTLKLLINNLNNYHGSVAPITFNFGEKLFVINNITYIEELENENN